MIKSTVIDTSVVLLQTTLHRVNYKMKSIFLSHDRASVCEKKRLLFDNKEP